jgi:hypothetical protein
MTSTHPFDPDASYCVYCRAVAAGFCATCGALCCADCAELVMGLTTQRAICRSCMERGARPLERRLLSWMAGVALVLVAAVAVVIWFLLL